MQIIYFWREKSRGSYGIEKYNIVNFSSFLWRNLLQNL